MRTNEHPKQYNNPILSPLAQTAISCVQFHAYDTPLLNQWHQLISAIRDKANYRQWVTLINPPFIPNDQYLTEIGLGDHYVRVIRLEGHCTETMSYIQRCLQNGKSSVVAVWADNINELPEIIRNQTPLTCQALVFADSGKQLMHNKQSSHNSPQLEMSF